MIEKQREIFLLCWYLMLPYEEVKKMKPLEQKNLIKTLKIWQQEYMV
jgi:hypothetical protein